MKKLSMLFLLSAMMLIFTFSAFAAENMVVWDFSKADDVARWVASEQTTVKITSDGAVISGEGDNLNLTYTAAEGESIVLENYKYFAMAYSGATENARFQFYHWTDKNTKNPYLQSQTSPAEGLSYVTFDLNRVVPATAQWTGTVKMLRLDPHRASDMREIKVHWVGLFKDEATYCEYAGVELTVREPGAPYIIWDFSKAEDAAQWDPSKTTKVEVTENGAVISGIDDDMNLTFNAPKDKAIYLEDYKIAVIEYADATAAGRMQLYHWTDLSNGNPRIEKTIGENSSDTIKYDFSASVPSTAQWEGKVVRMRFDPIRGGKERSITLRSIALFKDSAEYNTYIMGGNKYDNLESGEPARLYNAGSGNMLFGFKGVNSDIEYEDNYAVITSAYGPEDGGVGDPNFYVGAGFDGDKFPWMKVRLRNLSDATHFEMHFASDGNNNSLNAASCTRFPISSADSGFVEYIINVKDMNAETSGKSIWTGKVYQIRFDCMWKSEPSGQMASGSQMYIDYVAFFASEAEAKAYTPDPATETERPNVNSGAENPAWVFNSRDAIERWIFSGSDVSLEGGVLCIRPTTGDPTMRYELNGSEQFDTAEFPYFAYRHSTTSKVTVGGVFYTTNNLTTLSDASFSRFTIPNNGEWSETITNLSDLGLYPKANWNGTATQVRLDPINGNDTDSVIYIERMGFFRTYAEAYEFLKAGEENPIDFSKTSFFKSELQKSIIPGGTISEGYDRSQYMLSSVIPEGEGKNPVVMYTDNSGNTSVVALGYTTSGGYTAFVANKPGKYTIGYNHKEYSDISGHWGEQYINFVSDRTLFGGTSPTEFSPDDTMTRGMFITVLGRMHGVDTAKYDGNTGYGDVPATEYYAPYIQWAKEFGIMPGTSDSAFAPETPILRETMAAVISSYIAAFDYEFKCYDDPIIFNDLGDCDAATAQAIQTAQAAGIINGKGEGRFDPKGISTRAEVAAVMQRVIKAVLGVNTATTSYTNEYITRDRIRIGVWGFRIPFGTEEGMTLLRDLGADLIVSAAASQVDYYRNNMLNYADKYGIEIYTNNYAVSKDYAKNTAPKVITAEYSDHPSFSGSYFSDEPGTDAFGWMGDAADYYMENMPGKLPFVNLLPMYANAAQLKLGAGAAAIEYYDADPDLYRKYCQAWFENFNVDYICTDIYPLNGYDNDKSTWSTYKDYCESINQIATVARENDAEFWCCIQTWGWTAGKRNPTEAEYRWQCYTMLSYGCTGILLWSLTGTDPNYQSILNIYTLQPTQPLYDNCATVMWEMRNLSDTFVQYRNLGAFTINCTDATPYLKMSGEYKNFDILAETVSSEPLLIGCFDKKEGTGHAFTVVNMTDLKDDKPATFKFKLSDPMTVTLYDEAKPAILTADTDGYYTIKLESTDGVFVTIG